MFRNSPLVYLCVQVFLLVAGYYVARYLAGEFWLSLFVVLIASQIVNLFLYLKDWRARAGAVAADVEQRKGPP
jgi:small-conductance mechanosensitive channel